MTYTFFCDFDGTVTKEDLIDRILEKFADPTWMEIEQSWVNGKIGSRDCLAMQTKLIRSRKSDLIDFSESTHIDKSFIDFARYCGDQAIEIAILSDGIDLLIKTILHRYSLDHIRVYSNSLESTNGHFEMLFPYFREDCMSRSGVCKCKIMEKLSIPSGINILVGDGRSDFCLASKVDLTFAKADLLDFCRLKEIPHVRFKEFRDIVEWLGNQIEQEDSFLSRKSLIHHSPRKS